MTRSARRPSVPVSAVLVAALLAACAGTGRPPRSPSATDADAPAPAVQRPAPPWPASIGVPELRTVGDLPPADHRVVVGLDAVGRLTVDGDEATFEDMRGALRECAGPGGRSRADVLLALDGSVPWGVAARVVIECAIAGIDRLFFAARSADGGPPGAFALFLPSDPGVDASGPVEKPSLAVQVQGGWPPGDVLGLHDVIRGLSVDVPVAVTIDADPATPMDVLLRIADVAALEGASSVSFAAIGLPPLPAGETLEATALLRAEPPARRVIVFGKEVSGPGLLIPHGARVHGTYAGFFR